MATAMNSTLANMTEVIMPVIVENITALVNGTSTEAASPLLANVTASSPVVVDSMAV